MKTHNTIRFFTFSFLSFYVKRFAYIITFCIPILFFTACGTTNAESQSSSSESEQKSSSISLDCPFTELDWSSSIEEMISAEGDAFTTYDSVYGGTCYTYPKSYLGQSGTLKYMFNEKNELMCIAWAYGADTEDELLSLYDSINTSICDIYGESGYDANHTGNYGNVWYLDNGDIVLSTMMTSDNKALQYAYLHPLVSGRRTGNNA